VLRVQRICDCTRLFHFRYGYGDSEPDSSPFDRRTDTPIVKVDIRDGEQNNNLVACLAAQLAHGDIAAKQQVIFEPSDVVAFQLVRHDTLPSYSGVTSLSKQRFHYPKSFYLDRFMKENAEFSTSRWLKQKDILKEIQQLMSRKNTLTHLDASWIFRKFKTIMLILLSIYRIRTL